jgi:hypothetical protein
MVAKESGARCCAGLQYESANHQESGGLLTKEAWHDHCHSVAHWRGFLDVRSDRPPALECKGLDLGRMVPKK